MSNIIGYGEDVLTYWAITSQINKVLSSLGDKSTSNDVVVFYRPSFGRRGRVKSDTSKEKLSAEFGECDAIVGTHEAIYLIESKWESSPEIRGDFINLTEIQIHRHKLIRWYLENWRKNQPIDWSTFISQSDKDFREKFPGNKMALVNSILSMNLEFLLHKLSKCGSSIHDVLLFFCQIGCDKPKGVIPGRFHLVALEYKPLVPSRYFQMTQEVG
jgi:hypothetical protein